MRTQIATLAVSSLLLTGCAAMNPFSTPTRPVATTSPSTSPTSSTAETIPSAVTSTPAANEDNTAIARVMGQIVEDLDSFLNQATDRPSQYTIKADGCDSPNADATIWSCSTEQQFMLGYNPQRVGSLIEETQGTGVLTLRTARVVFGTDVRAFGKPTDNGIANRRVTCAQGAFFEWVVRGEAKNLQATQDDVARTMRAQWSTNVELDVEARSYFAFGYKRGFQQCTNGLKISE